MSFYVINPVHPHLGAAIDLRVFPLAAALEVGFADIAEAYVFYGDGVWQQGHQMHKKDGAFCFRIPQFTGARLYLRFYLADSSGQSAFTNGSEHEVTYGQYAHLFDDERARRVEMGAYILADSPKSIDSLSEQVSQALRNGAESLWIALGAEIMRDKESYDQVAQVLDSVHRLPSTFIELPAQVGEQITEFVDIIGKPWVKAIVLTALSPQEAVAGAGYAETFETKPILVALSPRNYLDLPAQSHPRIIPVGRSLQGLEIALLRGITANDGELAWLILSDCEPGSGTFLSEYAAATGVGHCFTSFLSAPTGTPFLARPLIPDLALICPQDYLDNANLPNGYSLGEIIAELEDSGFLCSVVAEGKPWKAQAAVWFPQEIEEGAEGIATMRRPIMVLSDLDQSEINLGPTAEYRSWPDSAHELCRDIEAWYSTHAEEQRSWVVIPGTVKGEKR